MAEAFAAAGFSVELPRLPGHGTTVEDMMTTSWTDWTAEGGGLPAAGRPHRQGGRRGLSMGGSLTLWTALQHPEVAGIVCINPATKPQPAEIMEMLHGMVDEGTDVMPGIGADIADPDATRSAYAQTPLRQLISLVEDGLAPLSERYGEITCPLLLLTSPQDHVVEPSNGDFLAETFGGRSSASASTAATTSPRSTSTRT